MTSELLEDVIAYHRELAAVREQLGRLAADLAILARQVADLKRDWPQDAPHFILVDSDQIN